MEKGLPVETRVGESQPRFSLAKGNIGKSQGEWLGAATPRPAALASQLHREPSLGVAGGGSRKELGAEKSETVSASHVEEHHSQVKCFCLK